jgi:hypothetical protein
MVARMRRDLAVLTADENMRHAVGAVLGRSQAIGIRAVDAEFWVHPEHDPGCRLRGHELLRAQGAQFERALVVFDREGCGDERPREVLETEVETNLASNGWSGRCAAVVIDPELEAWVWSPSPHVDEALGWKGKTPTLRQWLTTERLLVAGQTKPSRPKEAMERALEIARRPRSSARYAEIGAKVGLAGCTDAAFNKLLATLRAWFP